MFRDGPDGKPSEAIHLLFVGEKTRPDQHLPAPEITTVDAAESIPVIALESLVILKLMSNRDKGRMHLRDLLGVGLINASWLEKVPPSLSDRLQHILDTPEG